MKRTRAIIAIIILIVAAMSVIFVLQLLRPNHDPIIIEGNQDFEEQGWTGSGTPENPYTLSGFTVGAGAPSMGGDTLFLSHASIIIRNTTAHFVITNCRISGTTGVILENVANGTIQFCDYNSPSTTGGGDYAVRGYNLSNCTIKNNSFGNCREYCIMLEDGSSNTVTGNTIFFTPAISASRSKAGIYMSEQTLVNCRSNMISNCDTGIALGSCSGGMYFHWVSNNFIEECGTGLSLGGCSHLPVLLNELYNNTKGLSVSSCIAVNFSNNSVSYNSGGGVWVYGACFSFLVADNDISNNGWSGITFDRVEETTHPCHAQNNDVRNNDGWGIIVNGGNNVILTGNTFGGNTLGDIGYNISYSPSLLLAAHDLQPCIILKHDHVTLECIPLLGKRY